MKIHRRLFSKVAITNSILFAVPLLSQSQAAIRVYPSASKLAEDAMSLDLTIKENALSTIVNDVTSDVEIEAILETIQSKIDSIPNRKVRTRKEQVRNSQVEAYLIHSFLKIDNFKMKCFVMTRLLLKENEIPTFISPTRTLNGFPTRAYTSSSKIMSSKVISGTDVINVILSNDFHYDEEKIRLICAILTHILIQKFIYGENMTEDEARNKIVRSFNEKSLTGLQESKKRLINEIINICENVKYEEPSSLF